MKENSATIVAGGILLLFGVFVTLLVCYSFHTIQGLKAAEAKQEVSEAVIPLIGAVGNFCTSVFAPLLAFILGYYFSEKKKQG